MPLVEQHWQHCQYFDLFPRYTGFHIEVFCTVTKSNVGSCRYGRLLACTIMVTKVSIVTGGAQGIGKAFVGLLLEDGFKVSASFPNQVTLDVNCC